MYRLEVWCERGDNPKYGEYALLGAQQGRDFGEHYKIIQKHYVELLTIGNG